MSILGKILIVFNLLLGVGAIWLATQVQAKRQAWSYALLEHELLYAGLPIDPPAAAKADGGEDFVAIDVSTQKGAFALSEVRKATLQKMFDKYKGGMELGVIDDASFQVTEREENKKFVTSQQKELERVSDKVFASLDKPVSGQAPTPDQKRARLRSWLLSLSANGPQRDGINALLSDLFVPGLVPTARVELSLIANLDEQTASLRKIADAVTEGKDAAAVEAVRAASLAEAVAKASTESERKALESLSKLIAAPAEPAELTATVIETARLLLKARFEAAVLPSASVAGEVSGASPGKLSPNDKKFRIASILYNIDPIDPALPWDAAASPILTDADVLLLTQLQTSLGNEQNRLKADQIYKRVRLLRMEWLRRVRFVVGADAFRQVAEVQVANLIGASSRINAILQREDAAIRPRFDLLVAEAQSLADQFAFVNAKVTAQAKIVDDLTVALKSREDERDQLKMKLAGERTAVVERLAVLDAEEKKLFALQAELVKLQDRLFGLEASVRELELKTPPARTPR